MWNKDGCASLRLNKRKAKITGVIFVHVPPQVINPNGTVTDHSKVELWFFDCQQRKLVTPKRSLVGRFLVRDKAHYQPRQKTFCREYLNGLRRGSKMVMLKMAHSFDFVEKYRITVANAVQYTELHG